MRKTNIVVIDSEGRDKGKNFHITEMPAMRAEKWAARAFLAMAHAGVDVPPDFVSAGMAGIAVWGITSLQGINFEETEPLFDEMLSCVQVIRDPTRPMMLFPLREDDIEEVATLITLRAEVFALHTGFSMAELRSKLKSSSATSTSTDSSTTPTSPAPSPQ